MIDHKHFLMKLDTHVKQDQGLDIFVKATEIYPLLRTSEHRTKVVKVIINIRTLILKFLLLHTEHYYDATVVQNFRS